MMAKKGAVQTRNVIKISGVNRSAFLIALCYRLMLFAFNYQLIFFPKKYTSPDLL